MRLQLRNSCLSVSGLRRDAHRRDQLAQQSGLLLGIQSKNFFFKFSEIMWHGWHRVVGYQVRTSEGADSTGQYSPDDEICQRLRSNGVIKRATCSILVRSPCPNVKRLA